MRDQKIIVLLSFTVFFFQCCMLTGKMDKIVTSHYVKRNALLPVKNQRDFMIRTDSLKRINGACNSHYQRFLTVPLLVYFYSGEKIRCEINSRIYVKTIVDELNRLLDADSSNILRDKKLEIAVNALPSNLYHIYLSHTLFLDLIIPNLGLSVTMNKLNYPQKDIRISYILKRNDFSVLREGVINETVPEYRWERYGSFSQRRFCTENFIAQYDQSMTEHCHALAKNLLEQLKQ